MAKVHPGLPQVNSRVITKSSLLAGLELVDSRSESTKRVLAMENQFHERIRHHVASLPAEDAKFNKFNTSPFVLMIHCFHQGYSRISQLERDILPAKQFSSMETAAGRMVEVVTLPIYGWETVLSEMHMTNSALDGKCIEGDILKLATIKSGPRCLNDQMSKNFADAILDNFGKWATEAGVKRVEFNYGVLYGTEKQSNKKDWHILRNIKDKLPEGAMILPPDNRWECEFVKDGVEVHVAVRIGTDWWQYLGGSNCFMELCIALIRSCVSPGDRDSVSYEYANPISSIRRMTQA